MLRSGPEALLMVRVAPPSSWYRAFVSTNTPSFTVIDGASEADWVNVAAARTVRVLNVERFVRRGVRRLVLYPALSTMRSAGSEALVRDALRKMVPGEAMERPSPPLA